MRREQIAHRFAKSRCAEAIVLIAVDIFALLNSLDDRRVGRWSTDTVLLQLLDERWLGKARLGLCRVRHTLNRCNAPLRTLW